MRSAHLGLHILQVFPRNALYAQTHLPFEDQIRASNPGEQPCDFELLQVPHQNNPLYRDSWQDYDLLPPD